MNIAILHTMRTHLRRHIAAWKSSRRSPRPGKSLKELVTVSNTDALDQDEQQARSAVLDLAYWCNERAPLLERGREIGLRVAVSRELADAIEAVLPERKRARVMANLGQLE